MFAFVALQLNTVNIRLQTEAFGQILTQDETGEVRFDHDGDSGLPRGRARVFFMVRAANERRRGHKEVLIVYLHGIDVHQGLGLAQESALPRPRFVVV